MEALAPQAGCARLVAASPLSATQLRAEQLQERTTAALSLASSEQTPSSFRRHFVPLPASHRRRPRRTLLNLPRVLLSPSPQVRRLVETCRRPALVPRFVAVAAPQHAPASAAAPARAPDAAVDAADMRPPVGAVERAASQSLQGSLHVHEADCTMPSHAPPPPQHYAQQYGALTSSQPVGREQLAAPLHSWPTQPSSLQTPGVPAQLLAPQYATWEAQDIAVMIAALHSPNPCVAACALDMVKSRGPKPPHNLHSYAPSPPTYYGPSQ